jgi:hypothetical protein
MIYYTETVHISKERTKKKFSAPFGEYLTKILPLICSAAQIFYRPLLRFAAENSASWQRCPATISLTGEGQREQLKIRHVHHQQVVAQEINPTDWETHGGEEKDPLARDTANGYGERPLSPAGNEAAISAREAGTGRRVRRLPWHNREDVASVDQKI